MMPYIIIAIIAYLIGSINFSVIISKRVAGFDVREKGSGNAGTTNMLRTVGKAAAAITLVCDILKGVVAILLALLIGKIAKSASTPLLVQLAGILVIIGHTFPVFFKFKGGKGVATAVGVLLTTNWQIGLICLVFGLVLIALTRMVSLGSISAAILFPILVLFIKSNYIVEGSYFVFSIIIPVLVVFTHRENVKIGVFSGPSHAEEVSTGIPTAIVIASKYIDVLYNVQDALMDEHLRIYTSTDVKGVELGGALKNIMAFCAGIAAELQLGDNTFAALITRGLTEISRLGVAMGGNHNTFYGLSGLGDLIVTCLSEHSRNRRAGRCIGKGLSVEETREEIGMVVESFDNIEVTYKLSKKYNIEMPIVNTVYDILYNNLEPKEAVKRLMTREKKSE